MKKLRYGIIGAGWVADRKHLKAYSQFSNVELTAICNHHIGRAQVLAGKYQIPYVFDSVEEMFKTCQLDIVSICTPNALHLPMMKEAIKNGVHIHCEKPLTINRDEAEVLQFLNQEKSLKIFVGMNYRFESAVRYLKNMINSGEMGEIYHIKAVWHRRRGIPGLGGWFTNRELSGGGPLIDLGVHLIDLSMYILDFPNPTQVYGQTYAHFSDLDERQNKGAWASDSVPKVKAEKVVNVEDMAVGLVKFDNRSTLYFETSWAANVKDEFLQIEVFGTRAGAKTNGKSLEIYGEFNGSLVNVNPILHKKDPHFEEVQSFLNCIEYSEIEECTVEQAKKVMGIIDKIYQSRD